MPSASPTATPISGSPPGSAPWTTARRPPASATACSPPDDSGHAARSALDSVMARVPSGLETAPGKADMSDTDTGPEEAAATVAAQEPRALAPSLAEWGLAERGLAGRVTAEGAEPPGARRRSGPGGL